MRIFFIITFTFIHLLTTNYFIILIFTLYITCLFWWQVFLTRYIYISDVCIIWGIKTGASPSFYWFKCLKYLSSSPFNWDRTVRSTGAKCHCTWLGPYPGHLRKDGMWFFKWCTLPENLSFSRRSLVKWPNCLRLKHLSLSLLEDWDMALSLSGNLDWLPHLCCLQSPLFLQLLWLLNAPLELL